MYPQSLIDFIEGLFSDVGLNNETRLSELQARYKRYCKHPILGGYINSGNLSPLPIIDNVLWNYINIVFSGYNKHKLLKAYIIPFPLNKNHGFIEENNDECFIVINESSILFSEIYSIEIYNFIIDSFEKIDNIPVNIDQKDIDFLGDLMRDISINESGMYDNQIINCTSKIVKESILAAFHISKSGKFNDIKINLYQIFDMISESISCLNKEKSRDFYDEKIYKVINFMHPIEFDKNQYSIINGIMIGFIYRIIAHELVHRDNSHLEFNPKINYPNKIKQLPIDDVNKIRNSLVEIEADLDSCLKWYEFSNYYGFEKDDISPYIGFIFSGISDYVRAYVDLVCSRKIKISEFEEWICRSLNKDHRKYLIDIIGDYPTELERLEICMSASINMSFSFKNMNITSFMIKLSACVHVFLIDYGNILLDLIDKGYLKNRFDCDTCINKNPFLNNNVMKERLELFQKLSDVDKERIFKIFQSAKGNIDNALIDFDDKTKEFFTDLLNSNV